ncbi:unnamed protein product [Psylliodes chrysocephalus]|uniref:Uncharacterized protein n=1 Tax=Psylliodes chrysocephalus TaxID=3402493 RepID=A0A9P0CW21_9CUCU|nr:unnamed protein product [Psylliodes chrysocephala]
MEVQSYHWTNNQATLHPFVIYFKEDGLLKAKTLCVISDYLTHSTVSFFTFQIFFIDYMKNSYPEFKKIYYFSDGAAAQYKNKKKTLLIYVIMKRILDYRQIGISLPLLMVKVHVMEQAVQTKGT